MLLFAFFFLYAGRTANLMLNVWPNGGDVPFVWQAAFAEAAAYLDEDGGTAVALAGWSPETMDGPSMTLLRQNDAAAAISHFNPQEGTLLIPESGQILRPSDLPLDAYWETQLTQWDTEINQRGRITHYALPTTATFTPTIQFGDDLLFLGHDLDCPPTSPCQLITRWQVTAIPSSARRLFIQFLDENGAQLADVYNFDTVDPQGLWFPHWQTGDLILQLTEIPLTIDKVSQIRLGWFDPYTCEPGPCQNLLTETGEPFLLLPLTTH
jgi:hypothetical protein